MTDNKTAAEILLDQIIRRQIVALRVREGFAREQSRFFDMEFARPLLAEVMARLPNVPQLGQDISEATSKRLAALYEKLDNMTDEAYSSMRGAAQKTLLTIAKVESSWAASALARSVPIEFSFQKASPDYLRSIVRARPFQGKVLKAWYSELGDATKARVRSEIQQGLQTGQSVTDIAKRLSGTKAAGYQDGALAISRRHAETIAATAANHVSTHARQATYEANAALIKGYRFVATLDSQTSKVCASLDQKTFELGKGPMPPMHMRCRSSTVPWLKSLRELGIDVDDAPPGARASMNGAVPGDLSFEMWLKQQPEEFQRKWLGQGRFELWSKGLSIGDMIGPGLKPLPLSALTAD
jgi:SPP1 gp7 family putative phage head morphogenesis protein